MCYKPRFEPVEAIILRILIARLSLAEDRKHRFHNLVKGFEGEVMFDSLTEKLQCQSYILNDLLLESNGSKFQIDSMILTQEPLFFFEVKNYKGDYYFENDRFYSISKKEKEIKNPLQQLERSESLLRQLFQYSEFRIPIEAYVVFINPEFHCFQAPKGTINFFCDRCYSFFSSRAHLQIRNNKIQLKKQMHLRICLV